MGFAALRAALPILQQYTAPMPKSGPISHREMITHE